MNCCDEGLKMPTNAWVCWDSNNAWTGFIIVPKPSVTLDMRTKNPPKTFPAHAYLLVRRQSLPAIKLPVYVLVENDEILKD